MIQQFPGIYPKELKTDARTNTCIFIAVLFTIAKRCKQPKCLATDKWVNRLWYIHQWNIIQP